MAEKARQSGTSFQSRDQAVKSFSDKYAKEYTSKYTAEPAARPTYIPRTTTYSGRSYTVIYDRTYGGYGYYGPTGAWIMYDAMRDAAMVSTLMHQRNYYYPDYSSGPAVVYSDGGYAGTVIIGIILVMFVVMIFIMFAERRSY